MLIKSLKSNGISLAQAATGMSPADYPLGSLESRAIARALLDHTDHMKPRLSEYDKDGLTLYRFGRLLLSNDLSPSLREVERTTVYQHGRELAEREPTLEPRLDGLTCVEEMLERRGIEPPPRTAKWREAFLWHVVHAAALNQLQTAWERQLSGLPFPLRTCVDGEEVHLYLRQPSGEWKEETDESKRRRILGPEKKLRELQEEEGEGNRT